VAAKLRLGGAVLKSVFRVPAWTELRSFGDQRLAKASYVVLMAIPIISYLISTNPLDWSSFANFQLPLNVKMTFFASWFFSMALILFTVGCPKQFRKTDLLGQAKNINLVLSEVHKPNILIQEESEFVDPVLDESSLEVRTLCFLFYGLGVIYSVIILIRSAIFVVNS
jgi:hypothetical protein